MNSNNNANVIQTSNEIEVVLAVAQGWNIAFTYDAHYGIDIVFTGDKAYLEGRDDRIIELTNFNSGEGRFVKKIRDVAAKYVQVRTCMPEGNFQDLGGTFGIIRKLLDVATMAEYVDVGPSSLASPLMK